MKLTSRSTFSSDVRFGEMRGGSGTCPQPSAVKGLWVGWGEGVGGEGGARTSSFSMILSKRSLPDWTLRSALRSERERGTALPLLLCDAAQSRAPSVRCPSLLGASLAMRSRALSRSSAPSKLSSALCQRSRMSACAPRFVNIRPSLSTQRFRTRKLHCVAASSPLKPLTSNPSLASLPVSPKNLTASLTKSGVSSSSSDPELELSSPELELSSSLAAAGVAAPSPPSSPPPLALALLLLLLLEDSSSLPLEDFDSSSDSDSSSESDSDSSSESDSAGCIPSPPSSSPPPSTACCCCSSSSSSSPLLSDSSLLEQVQQREQRRHVAQDTRRWHPGPCARPLPRPWRLPLTPPRPRPMAPPGPGQPPERGRPGFVARLCAACIRLRLFPMSCANAHLPYGGCTAPRRGPTAAWLPQRSIAIDRDSNAKAKSHVVMLASCAFVVVGASVGRSQGCIGPVCRRNSAQLAG